MDIHFFGCGSSYYKCSSCVSHIYRQHKESIISTGKSIPSTSTSNNNCCFEDENDLDLPVTISMGAEEPVRTDLQHAVDQLLQTDASSLYPESKGGSWTVTSSSG